MEDHLSKLLEIRKRKLKSWASIAKEIGISVVTFYNYKDGRLVSDLKRWVIEDYIDKEYKKLQ